MRAGQHVRGWFGIHAGRPLVIVLLLSCTGAAHAAIPATERQALIDLYTATNGTSWKVSTNWNGTPGTECTWFGVHCDTGETTVRMLELDGNRLVGTLPGSLAALTNLVFLDLSENQLTESIPPALGTLASLQMLDLSSNHQLTGSIPAELGSLTNLLQLDLSEDQLTGSIPTALVTLASLQILDLSSNQLTGSIPSELGTLTNLRYLFLSSNQLTGHIPTELGALTNLRSLDLVSNQLTGPIPAVLGGLPNLVGLGLSSNHLTGSIPTELGSLTNLGSLYLASNHLTGVVPSSIMNLTLLHAAWSDFRWNGLYSFDPAVVAFLNDKQTGGDWQSTQTVPITDLTPSVATTSSVTLTWMPISYTGDTGGYQVLYSTTPDGPWTLSGMTADKAAAGWTVTGLNPGTLYYFIVKSVTNPHANNQNTVVSDPSEEVSGSTPGTWTLTVQKTGSGTGTVTSNPGGIDCGAECSADFAHGTDVTLMPTADAGSDFAGWSGACTGTGACVVTMDAPQAVSALFTLKTHSLLVNKEGTGTGTVTSDPAGIDCGTICSASFDHDTAVTLMPTVDAGSDFAGWSGACTGTGACVVTMDAAQAVSAVFTLKTHSLLVSKEGTGTGTVTSDPAGIDCGTTCSALFDHDTAVTLMPIADAGSGFAGWSGACTGTAACVVTMDAAQAVSAVFTLKTHSLLVSKKGTGMGTVTSNPAGIGCGATCSASFDHGTAVTLTSTPTPGSRFIRWSGACTGSGTCTATITTDLAVTAEFDSIHGVRRHLQRASPKGKPVPQPEPR